MEAFLSLTSSCLCGIQQSNLVFAQLNAICHTIPLHSIQFTAFSSCDRIRNMNRPHPCSRSCNVANFCISKMFSSFVVVGIVLLLLSGHCAAYSGLISADPENPGKCIYRGDALTLGVNTGVAPCQRLTCNEDGSILIEGCGKLRIENCNSGERISGDKPYPECCKLRYKCKKPDGTPYYIERDAASASEQQNKVKRSVATTTTV